MSEYIQESTDSIRTTKAYSCEGEQLKEFIRKIEKYDKVIIQLIFILIY